MFLSLPCYVTAYSIASNQFIPASNEPSGCLQTSGDCRISAYAEEVLKDIDPQKTQVSVQLDALRPIMEEIAAEENKNLEDIFILYMDLASEASVEAEAKLQADLQENGQGFSHMANTLQ